MSSGDFSSQPVNPTLMLGLSSIFGMFGFDRFYVGSYGFGFLKMALTIVAIVLYAINDESNEITTARIVVGSLALIMYLFDFLQIFYSIFLHTNNVPFGSMPRYGQITSLPFLYLNLMLSVALVILVTLAVVYLSHKVNPNVQN